ncbi:MAG TPA: Asp-tRNA(Asn)/Glu-tRNA(Gln) amidotransferase subunit GatC [Stellaceae bacterium]|nr:Asp-tRNA(Asn)/Glu-tRNA(Gln) amidotransferase subunit GatC [Stellaceae bacterium]
MALDKATVAHIATLARIDVPEADQETLARELSNILGWIAQLDEVPTEGVEPMSSVAQMSLPLREDVVTDGDCAERILANAPLQARGFFVVPKVVE